MDTNQQPDSRRIIFAGDNTFLRAGLEAMLERQLLSENECEIRCDEAAGLLIISPDGCDRLRRLALFSLVQRLRHSPKWRGVVLCDSRDVRSLRFARLAGLPVMELRQAPDALCRSILSIDHESPERHGRGVKCLTPLQWETVRSSLEDGFRREKRSKTFYTHRHVALARMGLRSIHELRMILSDLHTDGMSQNSYFRQAHIIPPAEIH